ncbi:MAG: FCD domain-containing protein [Paracoccaceae bacterium]
MAVDGSGESGLLGDSAFHALRAELRQGGIRAGQFLTMPGLVQALGYPIAAVREAVKRADAAGLLTVLPKRGVVVMDAGADTTRACMDMRAVLDTEGARRRIATGALSALAELQAAHRAMLDEARRSPSPALSPRAIETDLSLHDYLAAGLSNPHLQAAYAMNRDRIAVIQASRAFLADRVQGAMEEHLAILAALAAGDAAACAAAIRHHYDQTLRWWGIDPAD